MTFTPYIFYESRIPEIVEKITGINAIACSFGPFVFCRQKKEEVLKSLIVHETIHFRQQLELIFIFQWILYGLFHLIGLLKTRDTRWAYLSNPFELEAYDNSDVKDYLKHRKLFSWAKYLNFTPFVRKD